MAVRFHILGPVEVIADGQVLDVGHRQRELLTILLLRANELVTVDRLVEVSFPGFVPSTARRQVQNTVGRLRRTLNRPELIRTKPGGYLLSVGPDELDLLAYRKYVDAGRLAMAEGRDQEAVTLLRQGLALWRGPFLAEVNCLGVASEAAGVESERLAVLEECLDLEVRLGRHQEVLPELAALTEAQPLRERAWAARMRALYRCGCKADALADYQTARQVFVDELGLEPGPLLRDLHDAILTDDASLDPTREPRPPRPGQLPPDVPDFTGRETFVGELAAVLEQARERTAVAVAVVTGKAGVGKTTLALHVAHRLVAWFPDGQLFARLGAVREPGEVLAWFLRSLGVPGHDLPDEVEERAAKFRECLAGRRVLVVLDDAVEEAQVRPLLPGASGCAVLVTSRSRLTGLPSCRSVELDELTEEQSLRFLGRIAGERRTWAEPAAAGELVRLCGQLPLAIRIAGARLASRPHWTVGHLAERLRDERRRLDELAHGDLEVRSSIALSAEGLEADALRLLSSLALLDSPDICGWTVPAMTSRADLVESLVDAQLLQARRDRLGQVRYRFHDLVRVYARELTTLDERKAALERALSGWLSLVERAHRAVYGGDFAVLHGTAARWHPPGLEIVEADPLAWYETVRRNIVGAVRQAAVLGFDELCWDLAVSAVSLFQTRGHYDDWEETHRLALAATRAAGNVRGSAALLTGLGLLDSYRHRYEPAMAAVDEALELFARCGDRHGQALARSVAAFAAGMRGLYGEAVDQCRQALDAVRQEGDSGAEILMLRLLGQLLVDLGHLDTARPYLEEALAASTELDARVHPEVVYRIGELLLASGEIDEAEQAFTRMLGTVVAIDDPRGEAYARYGLGYLHLKRGQHTAGEDHLRQSIELARTVDDPLIEARAWLALGQASGLRGAYGTAVDQLSRAEHLAEAIDSPLWQARALKRLAEAHSAGGHHTAAARARDRAHALLDSIREAPGLDHL